MTTHKPIAINIETARNLSTRQIVERGLITALYHLRQSHVSWFNDTRTDAERAAAIGLAAAGPLADAAQAILDSIEELDGIIERAQRYEAGEAVMEAATEAADDDEAVFSIEHGWTTAEDAAQDEAVFSIESGWATAEDGGQDEPEAVSPIAIHRELHPVQLHPDTVAMDVLRALGGRRNALRTLMTNGAHKASHRRLAEELQHVDRLVGLMDDAIRTSYALNEAGHEAHAMVLESLVSAAGDVVRFTDQLRQLMALRLGGEPQPMAIYGETAYTNVIKNLGKVRGLLTALNCMAELGLDDPRVARTAGHAADLANLLYQRLMGRHRPLIREYQEAR